MPVGACDHCGHHYLVENGAPEQRCPGCRRPLRLTAPHESLSFSRQREGGLGALAEDLNPGDFFYETRILADSLTRWAAEAVDTSQRLRAQMKARREEARESAQALARQRRPPPRP